MGVPYDYSCTSTKDTLIDCVNMYCGLYFGSIKSKQNHSSYWHAVEDVDFDDAEADILEIVHEGGTPVLDGIKPVWTND